MAAKSNSATKAPAVRTRRKPAKASTARRGGPARRAGTVKEDKRTPSLTSPEKNLRKDHDKASYELEAAADGKRPTRKSTRRSANRQKPDSQLKRRQTRKVRSPENRHAARAG